MRIGNNFSHLCVCACVCLSVQAITFEPLQLGSSFSAYRYILTISRSSLSIKVIDQGQMKKRTYFIKCFCNLCVAWKIRLQLKGILVEYLLNVAN